MPRKVPKQKRPQSMNFVKSAVDRPKAAKAAAKAKKKK